MPLLPSHFKSSQLGGGWPCSYQQALIKDRGRAGGPAPTGKPRSKIGGTDKGDG